METTKLQGGKTDILSHRSTHSNSMDMEPAANERGRQTTYSIRRGDFSKVILATCSRGMSKNRPKLGIFGSRLNAQVSYGHGSGGK
jgi:hypothetical protein